MKYEGQFTLDPIVTLKNGVKPFGKYRNKNYTINLSNTSFSLSEFVENKYEWKLTLNSIVTLTKGVKPFKMWEIEIIQSNCLF